MSPSEKEAVCERLALMIASLVADYAAEKLNVSSFVEELLKLEKRAIQPAGFNLTASDTSDGWLRFSLRLLDRSEACAAFDCRLDTGEFKRKEQ